MVETFAMRHNPVYVNNSKVTTLVALLGGVGGFVRDRMKADGIYSNFTTVL